MQKIPVLLTSFIRPQFLSQILSILETRTDIEVFFASDGPRNKSDKVKIDYCLKIFKQSKLSITQDNLILHDKNYGTKFGIKKNIDWFFSKNEYGVVLEDDCIPSDLLFDTMLESLEKHKKSDKFMMISCSDYLPESQNKSKTFFRESYFPMIWGWASWANKWALYKLEIPDSKKIILNAADKIYGKKMSVEKILFMDVFMKRFSEVNAGLINTWDYSLMATTWRNDLVALQTNFNMIVNIGFGKDAAHNTGKPPNWVPKKYNFPQPSSEIDWIDGDSLMYDKWLAKNVYNCKIGEVLKNQIKRVVGK